MPTVLLLCGGVEAVPGIETVKRMGLDAVVMDGDPACPGREPADAFICANIYDPDEVVAALTRYPGRDAINAVITIAADNPMSVARAADLLGLNAVSRETANLSSNKLLQKKVLAREGIPVPWYTPIESVEQLARVVGRRPGRYVLKPIGSRGARGVIRLSSGDEVASAFEVASEHALGSQLILEEWLDGPQLSTESIVREGKSYLCGIADRNYERLDELYPYIVEDGGETPSRHSPDIDMEVNDLITKVARALKLESGSIKGDLVLTQGGPHVIEVAVRLSGGYFSTVTIPAVYGISIVEQVTRIALNQVPDLPTLPLMNQKWQCNRYVFLAPGRVRAISGLPERDPEVPVFRLYLEENDVVPETTNHTQRSGVVIAVGSSRSRAKRKCREVLAGLKIAVVSSDTNEEGAIANAE